MRKIIQYIMLFLGVTTLTSIIANKTNGFSKNPFKEEIKDVLDDNENVNLLTFYIEGVALNFEEGMTWAEWSISKYHYFIDIPGHNLEYFQIYVDSSNMLDVKMVENSKEVHGTIYIEDDYATHVYSGDTLIIANCDYYIAFL